MKHPALLALVTMTLLVTAGLDLRAGEGIVVSCGPNRELDFDCRVCEPGAGVAGITVSSLTSPVVIELDRDFGNCICGNCVNREAGCDFTISGAHAHEHLIAVEQWRDRTNGPTHFYRVDRHGVVLAQGRRFESPRPWGIDATVGVLDGNPAFGITPRMTMRDRIDVVARIVSDPGEALLVAPGLEIEIPSATRLRGALFAGAGVLREERARTSTNAAVNYGAALTYQLSEQTFLRLEAEGVRTFRGEARIDTHVALGVGFRFGAAARGDCFCTGWPPGPPIRFCTPDRFGEIDESRGAGRCTPERTCRGPCVIGSTWICGISTWERLNTFSIGCPPPRRDSE